MSEYTVVFGVADCIFVCIYIYYIHAFSPHTHTQVLDDYRGGIRMMRNLPNTEDVARWQVRNHNFILSAQSAEIARSRDLQAPEKQPNVDYMRAEDHALKSVSLQYADFRVVTRSQVLPPGASRYLIKSADLPPTLCADAGLLYRSCIEFADGKRSLELTLNTSAGLLIHCGDAGSIGLPSKHYLFSEGGLRGMSIVDPCHRRWDHFRSTVNKVGLKDCWDDVKVVITHTTALQSTRLPTFRCTLT